MGSGRGWLTGDWPSTGAFSTLLRRPGLRASSDGVLATNSERKMLAKSLYAWFLYYSKPKNLKSPILVFLFLLCNLITKHNIQIVYT